MKDLNTQTAKRIIETVGANGTPPEYGFEFFTAGLEEYLSVIESDYLSTFIKDNGSAFKMVVGVYGGGKTHFLYNLRGLAWKHNFVVSYVSLSPGESPFHKLDLVYKAIVQGMAPVLSPDELLSGYEKGVVSFIRRWFSEQHAARLRDDRDRHDLHEELRNYVERLEGIESISFANAVKAAFLALVDNQERKFMNVCQWLTAEGYDRKTHGRYDILEKIDRTTALRMVRSLVQWVREIGYSGLVVLLDEAERIPSLSTKQREQHLSNLREVIDECGHTAFQSVMIFYAVPDENFLEGKAQIYEALKQRVATVFEEFNPSGVKIELEKVAAEPVELLSQIGQRLARVYESAHSCDFAGSEKELVGNIAQDAYDQRFGDIGYKRLFVQTLVRGLHYLRLKGNAPDVEELR